MAKKTLAAGIAAALVGAAGCGSSGSAQSSNSGAAQQQQHARAEYQKCQTEVGSLVDAESTLNSHLDVGMNYHDYISDVGDVKAAYDQVPIKQMDLKCLTSVGVHAETALKAWAGAADTWTNCVNDTSCSNDSIKPELQNQWSKASTALDQAKSGLTSLQNGGG